MPAINNALFAGAVLAIAHVADIPFPLSQAWFIPVVSVSGAFVSLGAFIDDDIGVRRTLVAIIVHGMLLVLIFAGVYRWYGLERYPPLLDRDLAIYFSVVTWTTLGYGDFHPSEQIRLLAASQALLGYVFLGVIVGLTANIISRRR